MKNFADWSTLSEVECAALPSLNAAILAEDPIKIQKIINDTAKSLQQTPISLFAKYCLNYPSIAEYFEKNEGIILANYCVIFDNEKDQYKASPYAPLTPYKYIMGRYLHMLSLKARKVTNELFGEIELSYLEKSLVYNCFLAMNAYVSYFFIRFNNSSLTDKILKNLDEIVTNAPKFHWCPGYILQGIINLKIAEINKDKNSLQKSLTALLVARALSENEAMYPFSKIAMYDVSLGRPILHALLKNSFLKDCSDWDSIIKKVSALFVASEFPLITSAYTNKNEILSAIEKDIPTSTLKNSK